ncbi:MAG: glycosyltransferase family 4 protein [Oscillatoriophycideae cyanobacterium NC_groundwater_1537_Pr4_S-0.65um_50_18]|nr:glycosyltransferase family 4 protein [Oscillatoriophycideae cyanobacterium NC_groundwater_1537_Pr4_S-0.65um_50_18]
MKTLHISTSDLDGGAARAAHRLHRALIKANVDSQMLTRAKLSRDETVISHKPLMAQLGSKLDGQALRFYPQRDRSMFSVQWFPDSAVSQVNKINPDIVHLHWTCDGFLQIESLAKFRKPLVWTLHDMWAFTGGCHYTQECDRYTKNCGACPQLSSLKAHDLSRQIWQRKAKAWCNLNLTLITPSRWLAKCASASPLFEQYRVEVIPNVVDTQLYKPISKALAREALNLPQDKQLVLFGAGSTSSDPRKGFQFLLSALQRLDLNQWGEQLELAILGESSSRNALPLALKSHYLGRMSDDISLALAYAAADVFVAPSMQDNLPNTVVEALACGTPSLAFDIGGMPDMIEHQQNGYLAQPFDIEDLARGLEWILQDSERYAHLAHCARQKALESFSQEHQINQFVDLYKTLVG